MRRQLLLLLLLLLQLQLKKSHPRTIQCGA
jgi:hypothetical protein